MSTEERKTEVAPQPQRGGARRNYTTEKEKKKITQSCATIGVAEIPRTPPAPWGGGGSAGRKRNEHEKHTVLCLNLAARLPRPCHGPELGGGRQDKKTQEPPPSLPDHARNTQKPSPKTQKLCLVRQQSGLITQTSPGTERGWSAGRHEKKHLKS